MKLSTATLLAALMLASSGSALAKPKSPVIYNELAFAETDGYYGSSVGATTPGSTGSADELYFLATAFGYDMTIDFTDANGNTVATLFGNAGDPAAAYPGDSFELDGVASGDPAIGTPCVAGDEVACVLATGTSQDISSVFTSLDGGNGFFGDGSLDVTIDTSDVPPPADTPEPSSLLLLATGLFCGAVAIRSRARAGSSAPASAA
jgi:hypothetical protein